MRLTAYTNYALRTLMYAALAAPRLVRVQDVAEAHDISRAHLVKCVHRLGQWGYLDNLRGRNGGFRLAKPAEEIRIGEIVRLTEEGIAEVIGPSEHASQDDLRLTCVLEAARTDFLAVLDRHTIADVIGNDAELRALLRIEIATAA